MKEHNNNNNVDRISGLPDDVIYHILSFLQTLKSLVRTSALSKAWRFHWADVTTTAYYIEILWPEAVPRKPDSMFTTLHVAPPGATTDSDFSSWIDNIFTSRNVRKLVVHLNHHLVLPTRLFNSKTLVDLSLFDCGSISTKFAVDFPALKKLHLNNVVCEDKESLPHLLSRCPVLEELIVERMIFSANNLINVRWRFPVSCINVSSPTLNKVELDLDKVYLELHTPALKYLRLRLRLSTVNIVGALDSLIEADVDLYEYEFVRLISTRSHYTSVVEDIVARLCHVKRLTLSTRKIHKLNLDIVKFDNLTKLELSADWQFVTSFLENANNLRVLTIRRMVDHEHKAHFWFEPKPLPNCWRSHIDKTACLKSCLERVNVVDFGWSRKQELEMISYILRYAKVLKTMDILYTREYDSNQRLEAHNKLVLVERGSKKCQINFFE